jgi:hypothetical protein
MSNLNEDREIRNRLAKDALEENTKTKTVYPFSRPANLIRIFMIGAFFGFILGVVVLAIIGDPNVAPAIITAIIAGVFNIIVALIKQKV